MDIAIVLAIIKYGSYVVISYTLLRFAKELKGIVNEKDEPELNEIVKKPRLRR